MTSHLTTTNKEMRFYLKPKNSKPLSDFIEIPIRKHGEPRTDGRRSKDMRQMTVFHVTNQKAVGSSYVQVGNTKIITTIYGPRQLKRRELSQDLESGQISLNVEYAQFSSRPNCRQRVDQRKLMIQKYAMNSIQPIVQKKKIPKAVYNFYVMVIEDDGSAQSAAVNAISSALISSGIDIFDIAVSCSLKDFNGETLVDPTYCEELENETWNASDHMADMSLALMPKLEQIAAICSHGDFTQQQIVHFLSIAGEGCNVVCQQLNESAFSFLAQRYSDNGAQ